MSDSPVKPLVSIVIPVFNGADFLAEAIDSALAQTWPNTEVIVVDDGSDDGGQTAAIAARYGDRIRYHYKPNGGVATAINRGISLMRGEYFSWLSHDDRFPPDKLDRMMTAVLSYGEPVVAFGDFILMDHAGTAIREVEKGRGFDGREPVWAVLEGRINGCAMLIPRECFRVCGYLRPDLPATQDYDLWFRMALRFPFVHVPGAMAHHRLHENQGSRNLRFGSEVDLLFLSILDRVTTELIETHAPSRLAFYGRVQDSIDSPGVSAAVRREVRRAAGPLRIAALIQEAKDVFDAAQVSRELIESKMYLSEVAFFSTAEEDWSLLTVTHDDAGRLHLTMVSMGEAKSFHERLRTLVGRIRSEYVWVTPPFEPVQTQGVWPALAELLVSHEAVACVRDYPDGRLSPGAMGVLGGSVLRNQALQAALNESTGSIPSLVHALSRLGAIKKTMVSPDETAESAPEVPASSVAGTDGEQTGELPSPPPRLTAVGWACTLLSCSSLASRIATKIVWKFCGGGEAARKRLLNWTGHSGWFDEAWYRRRYPDVGASGVDPVCHYLMFGRYEGRDPSAKFSVTAYVADHRDFAAALLPALQHYVVWGRRRGRRFRPAVLRDAPLPEVASDGRPAVLFVLAKEVDRVTARFLDDLIRQISKRLRVLYLVGHGDGTTSIGTTAEGKDGSAFELPHSIETIAAEARLLGVRRIMILNGSGFSGSLAPLLENMGVPFDMVHFAHDLASAGPETATDAKLMKPAWPETEEFRWLSGHASRRFALSEDSASRMTVGADKRAVTVAQPPDPYRLRAFRVWGRPLLETEPLRIALFGSLDVHSGEEMLRDVLSRVQSRSLPLRFFVFGELPKPLPRKLSGICSVAPVSNASILTVEICRWHPHLAWFPNQTPATPAVYCYELTDAQANGLPVAAAASGDFPERLQGRPLTWLMPPESSADDWIAFFLRLREQGMPTEWDVPIDAPSLPDDHNLYHRYLFSTILGAESNASKKSH